MTRHQALREARKRWGARAMIRSLESVSSQERRAAAQARIAALKAEREAVAKERDARLAALPWLQEMNTHLRLLHEEINRARGEAMYYQFAVGYVSEGLGFFHVSGYGDTWREALEKAQR